MTTVPETTAETVDANAVLDNQVVQDHGSSNDVECRPVGRLDAAAVERLDASLGTSSPTYTIFNAPEMLRDGLKMWGNEMTSPATQRDIKHRFDPKATFAPGRFAGRANCSEGKRA